MGEYVAKEELIWLFEQLGVEQLRFEQLEKHMATRMEVLIEAWTKLNAILKENIGPDAMLGHSYIFDFFNQEYKNINELFGMSLLPQIADTLTHFNGAQHTDAINEILNQMSDCKYR